MLRGMKKWPCHHDKLVALRRIEGQIRGIHKMIAGGRYCVDILCALGATIGALRKVEADVLKDHLNGCVKKAFSSKSGSEKNRKIKEIYGLIESFRR